MSSTPKNGFREAGKDCLTPRHVRLAHHILAHKGSHLPPPETLRRLGAAKTPPVETVETLSARIRQLKHQHARDLETLFRSQLAEYHQELVDHRVGHDVSAYMDIDEAYPDQAAFKQALQRLDADMLVMDRFRRDAEDALATLRYTHLKTFVHLVHRRNALKAQDKAARQKRDAWFPQTTQQYHHITERDVQLRVARFLTCSTSEQERMMDEFGWAYRAVQPLLSAMKTDPAFKLEVSSALSGLMVTDPRRRGPKRREASPVFTRFSPVS